MPVEGGGDNSLLQPTQGGSIIRLLARISKVAVQNVP